MTKKRTYKAWTEYEEKTLADLRRKNVSVRHIAEILGRTMPSVTNRIAILGISNKHKRKNSWLDRLFFWR